MNELTNNSYRIVQNKETNYEPIEIAFNYSAHCQSRPFENFASLEITYKANSVSSGHVNVPR